MNSDNKDKTILIVDDNQDIRELLSRYVKKFVGCNIITASNGEEALHALHEEDINLVFLDVMMPGMDGAETIDAINEQFLDRKFRICMLTAKGDTVTVEQLVVKGVDDYILKPIDDDILQSKLNYLLAPFLSLERPPFATIKTRIYGIEYNANLTTISMEELSEVHARILINRPVSIGSVLKVQFKRLSRIVGQEMYFYLKAIETVQKDKKMFLVSGIFLAMDEAIRTKIRQVTITGQGISDGK